MKLLNDLFRKLVNEQVVLDIRPAPVNPTPVDVAALADVLRTDLRVMIESALRDAIIESKKPPEPVTRGQQPLPDVPVAPSLENELLAKLPADVQEAVRYACRKVQRDPSHPPGGRTLGNNWHRDEACEWAKTWLKERSLPYQDTDINLGCELYYRVYIRGQKS